MSKSTDTILMELKEAAREEEREFILDDLIHTYALWNSLVLHFGEERAARVLISALDVALQEGSLKLTTLDDRENKVLHNYSGTTDEDYIYLCNGVSIDAIEKKSASKP